MGYLERVLTKEMYEIKRSKYQRIAPQSSFFYCILICSFGKNESRSYGICKTHLTARHNLIPDPRIKLCWPPYPALSH